MIAIIGSRGFKSLLLVSRFIAALPTTEEIVSGGAMGVDTLAEQCARARGMQVTIFPAEWKLYGKSAAAIRNRMIVNYAQKVIAFWDGESRGTKMTIEMARKARKPYEIHYEDGRVDRFQ